MASARIGPCRGRASSADMKHFGNAGRTCFRPDVEKTPEKRGFYNVDGRAPAVSLFGNNVDDGLSRRASRFGNGECGGVRA